MPVSDLHPQYEDREYEWRQLRDCDGGMTPIKRSGTLYLPMPNSMVGSKGDIPDGIQIDKGNTNLEDKTLRSKAPWYHPNLAYSSYLQRARFPDITSSCKKGLVGVATKKDPEIKLPSVIGYLEDNATICGLGLIDLYEKIVSELLVTGRYEILVDPTSDNKFKFITYNAEDFINWKTEIRDDEEKISLSVLKEESAVNGDEFDTTTEKGYMVLRSNFHVEDSKENVINSFVYTKQVYLSDKVSGAEVSPVFMGKTLNFVPLVTVNAEWLGVNVGPSPLLGVSDIALSVYQKDADMSQSEYLTCNPMLVGFGIDSDEKPNNIGSYVSYSFENPEGHMEYVEPESTSLQHMSGRIKDLFEEASYYGAALLGPSKKAAEAAETVKIRQSSQGATLKTVCNMAAEGIKKSLEIAYFWATGKDDFDKIIFEPNLTFSEMNLTPDAQKALLQTWISRGISNETYFWNLKEAGLQPPGRTFEDEKTLIESSPPVIDDDKVTV